MEKEEIITPAKKYKLDKTLDPLEILHPDVFELIFQHFRNDDVLQLSETSPMWFEITEHSAKCMEKLHLRIVVPYKDDSKTSLFKFASTDLISQRNYQNIYLHNFREIVPEVLKTLTGRKWKKVYISARNLRSETDFLDIMRLIESSVVNLSISLTSLQNFADESEEMRLTFPHLENLDLNRCYGLLMKQICDDCRTLKILEIDLDHRSWSKHQEYLRKILANNEHLKKLTLWRSSSQFAFPLESIPSYHFKLKTFRLKNIDNPTREEENCLFAFLETQVGSLETLRLEDWYGIDVFKLTFKISNLRELTIDLYDVEDTIDWENLNLNLNFSIKKFHLDSYRNNKKKAKIFNALFSSMPALSFLTMDYLDNISLQAIGPRCQMLEELEIQELRATRVDNRQYFPRLKRFHCEDRITMKIKQRINRKQIHQRSIFEQLLLSAKPFFVTQ